MAAAAVATAAAEDWNSRIADPAGINSSGHVTSGFTSRMKQSIEFEELTKVLVAVEVDLEGVDTRRLAVAQQIRSDLGSGAVPDRSICTGGRNISGDGAELDPKAHARLRRLLTADPAAGLAQKIPALDEVGDGRRRRLPHGGKRRGSSQRRVARPPDPDRGVGLLQRLGADMHCGERKEPAGK